MRYQQRELHLLYKRVCPIHWDDIKFEWEVSVKVAHLSERECKWVDLVATVCRPHQWTTEEGYQGG